LSRILRILIQTHSEIKKNGHAQLLFESALVEACATNQSIRNLSEVTHILNELKALEKRLDTTITPLPSIEYSSHNNNKNQTTEINPKNDEDEIDQVPVNSISTLEEIDISTLWQKTLTDLQNQRLSAHQLLKDSILTPVDSNSLGETEKSVCSTFQVALVKPVLLLADKDKELAATLLSKRFGELVQLNFVRQQSMTVKPTVAEKGRRSVGVSHQPHTVKTETETDEDISSESVVTETPRRRQQQDKTPLMLQREVMQDKTLSPLLNMFDAKILKIQPK